MSEATPWRTMLALALSLGVPPAAFWRLALKEWRALTAAPAHAALDRSGFEAMAARFPDELKP